MAMEIIGRYTQALEIRMGQGRSGEWRVQDFILETIGQYPKLICISLWNDKIDALKNFYIGEQIKVSVDIESREFNGKWYTSIKAWQLEKVGEASAAPFAGTMLPNIPSPTLSDIPSEEEETDELPF